MSFKKILFPTDFSECAQFAMNHAFLHSTVFNAEVHALHAVSFKDYSPLGKFPQGEEIAKKLAEAAEVRMKEQIEDKEGRITKLVKKRVMGESPTKVITNYSEREQIDLIVMATHGHQGLKRLWLGSVTEQVCREAPCPVISVNPSKEKAKLDRIDNILVPIDFSTTNGESLAWAQFFNETYKAQITLLHVFDFASLPAGLMGESVGSAALEEKILAQKKAQMTAFAEQHAKDLNVQTAVEVGPVASTIAEYAETHQHDFLVMCTHGYTGFNHLILGSVTERVLRMAPCPVFTFKLKKQA